MSNMVGCDFVHGTVRYPNVTKKFILYSYIINHKSLFYNMLVYYRVYSLLFISRENYFFRNQRVSAGVYLTKK